MMDLPKNITQIGEPNSRCRVYVEDYVVSYLKQQNARAAEKEQAVALYGTCKTEGETEYYFVYGAAGLEQLHKETRHLSQAQMQEINNIGRLHFPEYQFLGYRILNGEMIEGFHICEQGICRYTAGYAQFYEKNERMLAYMLEKREDEAKPEVVEQEKYDEVRRRQEERREKYRESRGATRPETGDPGRTAKTQAAKTEKSRNGNYGRRPSGTNMAQAYRKNRQRAANQMKVHQLELAAAAVFGVLCLAGIGSLRQERMNEAGGDVVDVVGTSVATSTPDSGNSRGDSLVADERLNNALLEENGHGTSDTFYAAGGVDAELQGGSSSGEGQDPAVGQGADGNSGEASGGGGQGGAGSSGEGTSVESDQGAMTNSGAVPDGTSSDGDGQGGTGNSSGAVPDGSSSDGDGQGDANGQAAASEQSGSDATPTSGTAVSGTEGPIVSSPTTYIICKGDTLIGISIRYYGSDAKVQEICDINHIVNPDDIKVGAKILLP